MLDLIRMQLKKLGFTHDTTKVIMETWIKKEDKLEFRAQIGHHGISHNGLSIHASFYDGRRLYDSQGLLGPGVSEYFNPSGFLGNMPDVEQILERMDYLRYQAGVRDPRVDEISRAINEEDFDHFRTCLDNIPQEIVFKKLWPLKETFLHRAMNKKNTAILKALLDAGLDPSVPNIYGNAPIHNTYWPKNIEILLQAGAKVNIKDKYGRTPLHLAALHNHSTF